jgi:hypothetical protein
MVLLGLGSPVHGVNGGDEERVRNTRSILVVEVLQRVVAKGNSLLNYARRATGRVSVNLGEGSDGDWEGANIGRSEARVSRRGGAVISSPAFTAGTGASVTRTTERAVVGARTTDLGYRVGRVRKLEELGGNAIDSWDLVSTGGATLSNTLTLLAAVSSTPNVGTSLVDGVIGRLIEGNQILASVTRDERRVDNGADRGGRGRRRLNRSAVLCALVVSAA